MQMPPSTHWGRGMYTVCVKHGSRCIYIYTHTITLCYIPILCTEIKRDINICMVLLGGGRWILTPAQGLNGLLQHSPNGNGEGSI